MSVPLPNSVELRFGYAAVASMLLGPIHGTTAVERPSTCTSFWLFPDVVLTVFQTSKLICSSPGV